jgi:fido (protein-threonine AMPylation protein)
MLEHIFQLQVLNKRVLNLSSIPTFRNENVICLAHDGREIKFCEPSEIAGKLGLFLDNFQKYFDSKNIAQSISLFWLGFISIHPFQDGNGRTGKTFINEKLNNLGLQVKDYSLLDQLLLEGNTKKDLLNLKKTFTKIIINKQELS